LFSLNINPDTAIISESNIQAIKDGKAYINFMSHTYLRGTNIENQVVIIDEFQNGYGDECKKVLTRIHDSAKVIIIGEKSQCDIIKKPEKSGFDPYLKAFKEYKKENPDDKRLAICELKTNHRGWFSNFCDEVQL
jgi:phosphate starvation-inducible protein PhoH